MYRKQRLTPKLRKKQKIVVSTPQNLWYDTGNNPAQKGKTADMEKVEISGAALAPLPPLCTLGLRPLCDIFMLWKDDCGNETS